MGFPNAPWYFSAGAQWAGLWAFSLQLVWLARRRDLYVEKALVEWLPKKSFRRDFPGCRGKTIGSAFSRWSNPQSVIQPTDAAARAGVGERTDPAATRMVEMAMGTSRGGRRARALLIGRSPRVAQVPLHRVDHLGRM